MPEDRIKSEITIGYKAVNSKGETTLEIKPMTIIVSDQSPASASAHLASIVGGILAPAHEQAK
jgi:hypothetical protein